MKKTKFQGKLSLKKETVARLNDMQMSEVKGGSIYEIATVKCYVVTYTKTIPPCTLSKGCPDKISIKDVIVYQ
jgi:natural product precursor